jgi:hypothetical protein
MMAGNPSPPCDPVHPGCCTVADPCSREKAYWRDGSGRVWVSIRYLSRKHGRGMTRSLASLGKQVNLGCRCS